MKTLLKMTVLFICLIFFSCKQNPETKNKKLLNITVVQQKSKKVFVSDTLKKTVKQKPKRVWTVDNIVELLDSARTSDTVEIDSWKPFMFFKSGYFLSKARKNTILVTCTTDTTYLIKLFVLKNRKWYLVDSINKLDAFPPQFDIVFKDYNFDGQKDIFIQVSASNGWSLSRGHLLTIDPLTQKMIQHKEARNLANLNPNPKTKTVTSEIWNGYNSEGQNQLTILTNKWIDGKLKTIGKRETTIK